MVPEPGDDCWIVRTTTKHVRGHWDECIQIERTVPIAARIARSQVQRLDQFGHVTRDAAGAFGRQVRPPG